MTDDGYGHEKLDHTSHFTDPGMARGGREMSRNTIPGNLYRYLSQSPLVVHKCPQHSVSHSHFIKVYNSNLMSEHMYNAHYLSLIIRYISDILPLIMKAG